MRFPGMHVLLSAGVVTLLTVGTVSAFSLAGSGEAAPRLPGVAPPPAVAAPLVPAPLPAAAPAPEPAAPDPVAAEPTSEAEADSDTDTPTREREDPPTAEPAPPRDDSDEDRPKRPRKVEPDRNGTNEQRLAYACDRGFVEGRMCERFE